MQGEFEKKIQERMQTFGMRPAPQVWDDIDAALGKKRHRRVFIGWWILLGLVVAGGTVLLYDRDKIFNSKPGLLPAINKTDSVQNNFAQKQAAPNSDTAVVTANTPTTAQPVTAAAQKNLPAAKTIHIATAEKLTHQQKKSMTSRDAGVVAKTIQPAEAGVEKITASAGLPVASQNITPPSNKEPPSVLESGTDRQAVNQEKTEQPVEEVAKNAAQPGEKPSTTVPVKTTVTGRHQWFLTVSAGLLQTKQKGFLGNDDKSLLPSPSQMYYDNILALTSPAALKYSIQSPGAGFTVSVAAVYQYKLSRRWQVYGGAGATYLTNSQKTGELYGQSFSLSTGQFTDINSGQVQPSYYQGGSDNLNTVVNKALQLQVQAGVNYFINPQAKTRYFIDAGISSSWMVASRWLIPDARYAKLYYNTQVLNNTIVGWRAGAGIQLKNSVKFGVDYLQSFTTLAKSYVTPHLRWESMNIYAAIPFSFRLKKNSH